MKQVLLSFLAGGLVSLLVACAHINEQAAANDAINHLVEQIHRERSGQTRYNLSAKLVETVQLSDRSTIDDATIDSIAGLLTLDDEAVRGEAAMALGQLGPRARRALPALEKALDEIKARETGYGIMASQDSKNEAGEEICDAVRWIGGKEEADKYNCALRINITVR